MEGILKVINMLGLTINDLQAQIEQKDAIISNQQGQLDQLKAEIADLTVKLNISSHGTSSTE